MFFFHRAAVVAVDLTLLFLFLVGNERILLPGRPGGPIRPGGPKSAQKIINFTII